MDYENQLWTSMVTECTQELVTYTVNLVYSDFVQLGLMIIKLWVIDSAPLMRIEKSDKNEFGSPPRGSTEPICKRKTWFFVFGL